MLRAELFDRKPFVSLFPGRVGSIRLMKYSPESPAETWSKAVSGCSAIGTWGLLESESASKQENMGDPVSPLKFLLPFLVEQDHCDLPAVHTGLFPPVQQFTPLKCFHAAI